MILSNLITAKVSLVTGIFLGLGICYLNKKKQRFDIQYKGSGQTPYSRGADGRAALGPMLREYLISESMYGLGIPTTRSLAVVKTGEEVIRETSLQGAILTRVPSSHITVGTFQYIAARKKKDELEILQDYVINRHYPIIKDSKNKSNITDMACYLSTSCFGNTKVIAIDRDIESKKEAEKILKKFQNRFIFKNNRNP